jgi:hypothetical protein
LAGSQGSQGAGNDLGLDEEKTRWKPTNASRTGIKFVASDAFRAMPDELMSGIMAGVTHQFDKVERAL